MRDLYDLVVRGPWRTKDLNLFIVRGPRLDRTIHEDLTLDISACTLTRGAASVLQQCLNVKHLLCVKERDFPMVHCQSSETRRFWIVGQGMTNPNEG